MITVSLDKVVLNQQSTPYNNHVMLEYSEMEVSLRIIGDAGAITIEMLRAAAEVLQDALNNVQPPTRRLLEPTPVGRKVIL